jgi:hypothetical protein
MTLKVSWPTNTRTFGSFSSVLMYCQGMYSVMSTFAVWRACIRTSSLGTEAYSIRSRYGYGCSQYSAFFTSA